MKSNSYCFRRALAVVLANVLGVAIPVFCSQQAYAGALVEWERHFGDEILPPKATLSLTPRNSNVVVCVRTDGDPAIHLPPNVLLWWGDQNGEKFRSAKIESASTNAELKLTLYSRPCVVALDNGDVLLLVHSQKGGTLLQRTDSLGNAISVKRPALPPSVFVERIVPSGDGNFLVGGQDNNDAFAAKIDPQGNEIWENTYGRGERAHFTSILPTQDGGSVFVGNSTTTEGVTIKQSDVWALKCDSSGIKLAEDVFPGRNARAVKNNDGNCVIIYDTRTENDDNGVWVRALDAVMNELWSKQLLAPEPGTGDFYIAAEPKGGYVIAGM
jgi:hypothetical protein